MLRDTGRLYPIELLREKYSYGRTSKITAGKYVQAAELNNKLFNVKTYRR